MNIYIKSIFLIIISIITPALFSQEEKIFPVKLDENLFHVSGTTGGNIVFLVTEEGVLVIDAGYYVKDGETVVKIIQSVTDKPIKFLIFTHFHGDHTKGASGFPKNIQIIAHENLKNNLMTFNEKDLKNDIEKVFPEYINTQRKKIEELKKTNNQETENHEKQLKTILSHFEEIKKIKFRYPDITFADTLVIRLGDEEVLLQYVGNAHTNDNIVVIFKNHNTIHTGDLIFNRIVPYLIPEHGTDSGQWMKVLYRLHKNNYDLVIPGHGKIDSNEAILRMAEYFRKLRLQVQNGIKNQIPLSELCEDTSLLEEMGISQTAQFSKNIEAIYEEMKKSDN